MTEESERKARQLVDVIDKYRNLQRLARIAAGGSPRAQGFLPRAKQQYYDARASYEREWGEDPEWS